MLTHQCRTGAAADPVPAEAEGVSEYSSGVKQRARQASAAARDSRITECAAGRRGEGVRREGARCGMAIMNLVAWRTDRVHVCVLILAASFMSVWNHGVTMF